MEVNMKRFITTIAVFGVSILAVWAIFQATGINDNTSTKVRPSPNELMKILNAGHEVVVPVPSADARKIAPVFDITGSVVSDPSGTILNAGNVGQSAIQIEDQAQPGSNYAMVKSLPVTGADVIGQQAYDFEQEARAYPSHRLHSACASADIHRQGECAEQEPKPVILHSNNDHAEQQVSPIQNLHSHCVSEDINRQYYCMD
jgi:hypothetical protein